MATVAAVVVALVLARRDERIRLSAHVATGRVDVRSQGKLTESRFEILIEIANIGRRPVQVTGIGWRVGYLKRQRFVQVFDTLASQPPSKLSDGDTVVYIVPLAAFDREFPAHFARLSAFERRWAARSLRLLVYTSGPKNYPLKPHSTLRKHLRALLDGGAE